MGNEKSAEQILAFARSLTQRQWLLLGVAMTAVIALLWFFVGFTSKADFRPLYTGLSQADAQALSARLETRQIRFELSSDGTTIRVPADELDRARLELASQGMPRTGRMGFELFDKPNWAGSTFSEKVNYQRALEGELERTIQSMQEVEAARVHLVMPQPSLFSERDREAKAGVVVKLRGARLDENAIAAVRRLVASSVEGLAPHNVTIVNADGGQPLTGDGESGRGSSRPGGEEKALVERLMAVLVPVVGEDKVRATVTLERDLSTSESTKEEYDPNATVVLSSQISEERYGGNIAAGIPGTASNVPPSAPPAANAGADTQMNRTESKTYAVSKMVRVSQEPPGRIKRMAAAVLVDDVAEPGSTADAPKTRRRTPEEMKQLEELAKAALGFDAQRGDQLSVQNLTFRALPVETPAAPSAPQRILQIGERALPVLRYVALLLMFLLAYFLMLRPLQKQILASFARLPAGIAPSGAGAALAAGGSPALPAHEQLEAEHTIQAELSETSSEIKRAVVLKRHLVDKIKKEPAVASRLIQTWIRHEEARK